MRTQNTKNIVVAATMSAGKSSLVNALLGTELLHSANEATTAKVTRIHCKKNIKDYSIGYCSEGKPFYTYDGVCSEKLKKWNQSEHIDSIDVFLHVKSKAFQRSSMDFIINDTPGPNNSRDTRHKDHFVKSIKNNNDSTVIYILNATQLATTDDQETLKELSQYHQQDAIKKNTIFVLNKVDSLDCEHGEHIDIYVKKAKLHLNKLGFKDPIIVPMMTHAALIARKILYNEKTTRKEKNIVRFELEKFRENQHILNNASIIPYRLRKKIRQELNTLSEQTNNSDLLASNEELELFISYCGLSAVEHLIFNRDKQKSKRLIKKLQKQTIKYEHL